MNKIKKSTNKKKLKITKTSTRVKITSQKKIYALVTIIIFILVGAYLLYVSTAVTLVGSIPPASNPKTALGVGGVSYSSFAKWLDRSEVIKYGEFNKHFSPGIEKSLTNIGQTPSNLNRTIVVTVALTADNTIYLKNTTADPSICGNNFKMSAGTYKGKPLATNTLGNADQDKNLNGIKDNIENLNHTVKGCYDNTFEFIGDAIFNSGAYKNNSDGTPKLIIRLGHEHNGDWYEWSSNNQIDANKAKAEQYAGNKTAETLYKEAYIRAHGIIVNRVKSKAPDAKVFFEWNGTSKMAVGTKMENTYPGNEYVDVIGIDFYDRDYLPEKGCLFKITDTQVPDCRTQTEKVEGWAGIESRLDTIANFAKTKNKLIGISEVHNSATVGNVGGVERWIHGLDNTYFTQKVYEWTKKQTDNKTLAYIIFFERNGGFSKEVGITGAKSFHKFTPGYDNATTPLPNVENIQCALEWDYGGTNGVQRTMFEASAIQFLKLWSGPANNENIKGSHPNCKKIGVVNTGTTNPTNIAPVIIPKASYSGITNTAINLSVNVSDDGLPSPINARLDWSKKSGPGNITFNPASNTSSTTSYTATTSATFSAAGTYIVTASAKDGSLTKNVDLTITILDPPPTNTTTQETIIDTSIQHDSNTTNFTDIAFNKIADWTNPVKLSTGKAYVRLESIDFPVTADTNVTAQICFYKNNFTISLCSPSMTVPETLSGFYALGSPSANNWTKVGNWDFTKAPDNAKIILRDASTNKLLLTTNCGNECSDQLVVQDVTPIVLNVQMVLVANGQSIKALDNWLFDPRCAVAFGCGQSGTKPQKPIVKLNHPSKILFKDNSITFNIDALDDKSITKVELINKSNNGSLLGSVVKAPYDVVLNTNTYKNGDYIITAKAYDADGNVTESIPVTLKLRKNDISQNGTIDITDIAYIINNWNKNNVNVKPTNIECDLNDDGIIDSADLDELLPYWNRL